MRNIWISGSINSGKSTVAKILAKKMKLALIELDVFSEFLPNIPLEDKITINLNLAIEAVKIYNKNGIGTVCVYPLSQMDFDYLKKKIKNLTVYTLNLPLDIVLKNRGQRVLNKKEKDRIKYHYSKGINNPKFGVVIDTENLSPNQIVSLIIR
jgi:cytidylate kinase